MSLTRQQDLAGRLARQACPAGYPCRPSGFLSRLAQQACPAGLSSRLAQQATSAGRQACPAGLPSRLPLQTGRLPQQACSAGLPSRLAQQATPAGRQASGQASSSRPHPQGFSHKTSFSRLPPQDLQRVDSPPCRLFLAVACKHVFSNLQCSNYYNG